MNSLIMLLRSLFIPSSRAPQQRRTPLTLRRVTLSISRTEASNINDAEQMALGIYRQFARRPLKIVDRIENAHEWQFTVDLPSDNRDSNTIGGGIS